MELKQKTHRRLAVGLINLVNNQNPTAAPVSSAFSSRFRFKLRFTFQKLWAMRARVKCFHIKR